MAIFYLVNWFLQLVRKAISVMQQPRSQGPSLFVPFPSSAGQGTGRRLEESGNEVVPEQLLSH